MKNSTNSIAYLASITLVMVIAIGSPAAVYAQAAEPLHIGYASQVERNVAGQLGAGDIETIQIEDDIFFSEIITTEADASAIMSFRDGSSLEIGPNSALTIDEFIFNPAEGVKIQTITALVGSFRFISGMAMPNQTITINTPTATMGIRGSTVPFVVGGDGATAAVPTSGSASFAPLNNPAAGINIQTGNVGVIRPGSGPVTGPAVRSVGRQVVSRTRQVFGSRPNIPMVSQQRQTRDAQANQQSAQAQQQAMPAASQTTPTQLATQQAAINARQDQTMDALGITSITLLDNAGVLDAGTTPLGAQQQTVVDSLDDVTAQLQNILDAAQVDGEAASQTAHQQGTDSVISGLAQTGDADAVIAATGNAAQADPDQAAPAVAAAAANLPNLDADTMTGVLQSAVDGLQTGGDDVTGAVVGSLTATAINNMPPDTQNNIGSDVAVNISTDFATQQPTQAADLAAALTTQLPDSASNIATDVTQNLATTLPAQATAINTASNNAAAANLAALPVPAAGPAAGATPAVAVAAAAPGGAAGGGGGGPADDSPFQ